MPQHRMFVVTIIIIAALFGMSLSGESGQSSPVDWKPVEQAMGMPGKMLPGGVFKIALPRNEPRVVIGDVRLDPGMVLDSWISFIRMGDGAMMMGDIVLTVDELKPVQQQLTRDGIDVTAVHNTLVGERPQVYDMHISGTGDPVEMAKTVRSALGRANITYGSVKVAPMPRAEMDQINGILGYKGTAENGIYIYEIPRAEPIRMEGMEIPPTMDVSTAIKFQPLGNGRSAVTGDFILRGDEVKPTMKTLNENGLVVTALHMHMLNEEPRLFMMHFWATGNTTGLANGLRQALDKTNSVRQ